jgi:hypothetical protein
MERSFRESGGEGGIRTRHIPSESTVFIGLSENLPKKMSK